MDRVRLGMSARSLVRAFHEVRREKSSLSFCPGASPCRAAAVAAESSFRLGNGEHAARGIKAREVRAAAAGAGGHAASSRRLRRADHEVSAVQNNRPARQAQRPAAVATTEC